jgi:ABC-2 type transport system permease protein
MRYSVRHTLSVRTELARQVRRKRTLIAFLLVLALPLIVVAAVKLGPSSRGFGDGDLDLVGLATSGAWNFTLTMLFFGSGFLLTIIAALFLGDTVASEASWSSLRYLLAAPVPRRRLLWVKVVVGLVFIAGVLLLLVLASYVIGLVAFGSGPLTSPVSGTFDTVTSLQRLGIITGYIGLTLLFPAGIAFVMSVLTDVPLGAVGAAVVIVIISSILDTLEPLGDLRRLFPTDYGAAWLDALDTQVSWNEMAVGGTYQVVIFAACVAAAIWRFDRKDVLS